MHFREEKMMFNLWRKFKVLELYFNLGGSSGSTDHVPKSSSIQFFSYGMKNSFQ